MTLLIAVVPVIVALWLATTPVSAARVAGFERRHGVPLVPPGDARDRVVAYLGHTRRWRAFGAAAGYAAGAAATFSAERAEVPVLATAAGWLAGAAGAEFGWRRPDGGELPRLLRRVPVVLAAVGGVLLAPGVVALSSPSSLPGTAAASLPGAAGVWLPVGRAAALLGWGVGALACAGVVWWVLRRIAGRAGAADAVGRAIGVHSASAVAGVGVALVAACVGGELAVVGESRFDSVRAALGVLSIGWALGGIALGWWVAHGSVRPLIAIAVALVLLSVGAVGVAWRRDRPPFPAAVLHPTAAIRLTDFGHSDTDARALGITGLTALADTDGMRSFVGRVDYRPPPGGAPGTFTVVVIDKRRDRVADQIFGMQGGGWDGTLSVLPRRYRWLSAMSPVAGENGWTDAGSALTVAAGPGPIVFNGKVRGADSTADDLLVALIFQGPHRQTYWAARVLG